MKAFALLGLALAQDAETITHNVWFDIEIGGQAQGRIEMGLFGGTVRYITIHIAAVFL